MASESEDPSSGIPASHARLESDLVSHSTIIDLVELCVSETANYSEQPKSFIIYWMQPKILIIYWMQLSGIRVSILGQFIGYFSNIRYLNLLANTVQI